MDAAVGPCTCNLAPASGGTWLTRLPAPLPALKERNELMIISSWLLVEAPSVLRTLGEMCRAQSSVTPHLDAMLLWAENDQGEEFATDYSDDSKCQALSRWGSDCAKKDSLQGRK